MNFLLELILFYLLISILSGVTICLCAIEFLKLNRRISIVRILFCMLFPSIYINKAMWKEYIDDAH